MGMCVLRTYHGVLVFPGDAGLGGFVQSAFDGLIKPWDVSLGLATVANATGASSGQPPSGSRTLPSSSTSRSPHSLTPPPQGTRSPTSPWGNHNVMGSRLLGPTPRRTHTARTNLALNAPTWRRRCFGRTEPLCYPCPAPAQRDPLQPSSCCCCCLPMHRLRAFAGTTWCRRNCAAECRPAANVTCRASANSFGSCCVCTAGVLPV